MTLIEKCDGLCVNCKREVCVRECTVFLETEEHLTQLQVKEAGEGYGVAFDLGTTTLVASLVDLHNGKEVCRITELNPQRRHGQDVLSRITFVQRDSEEAKSCLQEELLCKMNEMLEEFADYDIKKIVVAANCIMAHFLLGEDACGMGVAPYCPTFTETRRFKLKEIPVLVLPHASAYVGGDVVGGLSVTPQSQRSLYLDIGTNGEMVLKNGDNYYTCSCAVGPALEGMGISCGMPAGEGAIDEVVFQDGKMVCHILGDGPAKGLCGSGVLTAIKALLEGGILQEDGAFVGENTSYTIAENVVITQQDIRQIQLAKGAILSGVQCLLAHAKMKMEDVEQVYIAGTFGKYIPQKLFTELGVLPKSAKGKIVQIGNGALSAAQQVLCDENALKCVENLCEKMEYVELAMLEDYMQIFVNSLSFTFAFDFVL